MEDDALQMAAADWTELSRRDGVLKSCGLPANEAAQRALTDTS